MKLVELNIKNLRNHIDSNLEFASGTNIIYGYNGVGKTSILEAISIAGLTKSFLPVQDSSLINHNAESYYIHAKAKTDHSNSYNIKILYKAGSKKEISGTEGENMIPKNVIGLMPIVVLSPDHKAITFGSPIDRRAFIDRTLSQSNKKYIDLALKLKKCLRQRNNILNEAKRYFRNFDKVLFEAWTESLIDISAEMVVKRAKFLNDFDPYFKEIYSEVTNGKEKVELQYQPDSFTDENQYSDINTAKLHLEKVASNNFDKELKRGTTIFGPQKDELAIIINGSLAKDTASQGQHKSLLISLKFAEFNFLKENKQEMPIILLDDIFSELDSRRSELVLHMLRDNQAQTFITLTDREIVRPEFLDKSDVKYFEISEGEVVK